MNTIQRLKLKDIRKGQDFIEEDCGTWARFEAIEDAREVRGEYRSGYECRAKVVEGEAPTADKDGIVTFFECFQPGGYGLRLYQHNAGDKPADRAARDEQH